MLRYILNHQPWQSLPEWSSQIFHRWSHRVFECEISQYGEPPWESLWAIPGGTLNRGKAISWVYLGGFCVNRAQRSDDTQRHRPVVEVERLLCIVEWWVALAWFGDRLLGNLLLAECWEVDLPRGIQPLQTSRVGWKVELAEPPCKWEESKS